ncbi:regulator of chromosome condensation-like [Ctenocephalides felis]|uniref:regulator of chromosome condensation-like n=1 Tax=Ctenocephalides felis TaxID=7515 RepID=UPI000E6E492F|nr:regulator of chromosome condensation-like [Ctenocephalides felis]
MEGGNGTERTKRRATEPLQEEPTKKIKSKHYLTVPSRNVEAGRVLVCGENKYGQLGLGPEAKTTTLPLDINLEDIVAIDTGSFHSVCLNNKGEVFTFGHNRDGVLGRNTDYTRDQNDLQAYPGLVNLPNEAVKISAGDYHSCALLIDGTAYVWGIYKETGELLEKTYEEGYYTCNRPELLSHTRQFVDICSGIEHLLLLDTSGKLYTVKSVKQRQRGRQYQSFSSRNLDRGGREDVLVLKQIEYKLSPRGKIDKIWAGGYSSFIKRSEIPDVYAFGSNACNKMGLGEDADEVNFPRKSQISSKEINLTKISTSLEHTLAIDMRGKCYSIGNADFGLLGLGNLDDFPVDLAEIPNLRDKICVDISCGIASSFAITDQGDVYAWGSGTNLGIIDWEYDDIWSPVKIESMPGKKVMAISPGYYHTLFLVK